MPPASRKRSTSTNGSSSSAGSSPAVISSERDTRGVTLIGIEPEREREISFVAGDLAEGEFLASRDDRGLILGRKLVERLETGLGKRVVIMSQDPDNDIADRGFRIVGVYKGKLAALEEGTDLGDVLEATAAGGGGAGGDGCFRAAPCATAVASGSGLNKMGLSIT